MIHKLKFIILLGMLTINCYGQKVTTADLLNLSSKKNWEDADTYLNYKGWNYYDSKKGEVNLTSTIVWSYEKEDYNDKAQGWIALFTFDGIPNKITYNVYNKESYLIVQNSIVNSGFKRIKSEIEDNTITSKYSNNDFILEIVTQKTTDKEYPDRSSTTYYFTLIRRRGIYDLENGKKYEYFDNGQIKSEVTLLNGEINGEIKSYYENGKIERVGFYVNGKENGKFYDYDENGKLEAEYTKLNGETNGIVKIYKNNLITQELIRKNGVANGKFTAFYYDENNNLNSKIVGNFKDDKEDGLWQTISMHEGKEEVKYFTNYNLGIKNGRFEELVDSDTLEIGTYKNGLLDGFFIRKVKYLMLTDTITRENKIAFWNEVCAGDYSEGKENGKWTYYFFGNKMSEGYYENGKKVGKWINYVPINNHRGEIFSETNYKNNVEDGIYKQFFISNTDSLDKKLEFIPIQLEYSFINGKRNGDYQLRDSIGRILITGTYANDLNDNIWSYYDLDSSYHSIEFKNDIKEEIKYYNRKKELYLIETYDKDKISECEYYNNSVLSEKHFIQNISEGYKVNVIVYSSAKQDSISYYNYVLNSKEEYYYKLLDEKGIKEGEYKFLVNNEIIINGKYCQNQKCGYWIYEYPKSGIYSTKLYRNDMIEEEKYFDSKSKKPFSGKLELKENNQHTIIKIKKGLRDGYTIFYDPTGLVIRKEAFKKGVKLQ